MGDAGRTGPGASSDGRSRLLAGAAVFVLVAFLWSASLPAHAQAAKSGAPAPISLAPADGPPHPADRSVHGAPGPDGLSPDELYLEAESVARDDNAHLLIATGSVQARYQGRTLRAREIIYNTQTGLITANGSAQIINEDGTVQYAEHLELDDKLHAGAATGFATRESQNVKIAAASAVRRSETVNELNRAIFTPCEICAKDGKTKEPTWSIQAERVVQDKARKIVIYHHAVIKVKGVPIFYAPVLTHPDPSAPRASGLLAPRISVSNRRGFSYEQPYIWIISPSQDLTISPQFSTKINPFVNLDWRKRFWSGQIDARFGYTYDADTDSQGRRFGDHTSRSYVLATGAFQIDQNWRWGFSAERTSDPTIFDRYSVPDVYEKRGLIDDDERRLTSQLFAIRQDERSFLSVSAISFQSYRPWIDPVTGLGFRDPRCTSAHPSTPGDCPLIVENNGAMPLVAPLIEARWEPNHDIAGGRLRVTASAVAITREEQSLAPCQPLAPGSTGFPPCSPVLPINGVDSRRATGELDWRGAFFTSGGIRVDPFVHARGDAYSLGDLTGPTKNLTVSRGSATAGVDVTYPMARRFGSATVVLEPIVQAAISPKANLDPNIPNQDSFSFSVDETNLFRTDKFTGFDIYEGGARLNAGVRATVDGNDGRWARFLFGRSFRSGQTYAFAPGINTALQNWVVAFEAAPLQGLTAFGRADIDNNTKLSRAEGGVNWSFTRTHGFLRYFRSNGSPFVDPSDPFLVNRKAQDLEAAGDVLVTRHWGLAFDVTRDMEKRLWRRSEIGILYQDDCLRAEVTYQRNETSLLGRTDAVFLRLDLATLGDTGYRRYDDR